METREILENIGYKLTEQNDHYRTSALYREGNNPTSLSINKTTGWVHDFVSNEGFPIEKLIILTTNCSEDEAKKLTQSEYNYVEYKQSRMEVPLILNKEEIKYLIPSYYYFNNRGISTETLKHYQSGLATQGKMSDRFTFPIINKKGQLVGLSGRDATNKKEVKWKHLGRKNQWDYPYYFNKKEIESANEIILIEGISDLLALHEAGIKNVLVLFGLSLGKELITTLLTLNKNIWICTNNDPLDQNGHSPGIDAANKLKKELERWFSEDKIYIELPPVKDFGEMKIEEIKRWYHE